MQGNSEISDVANLNLETAGWLWGIDSFAYPSSLWMTDFTNFALVRLTGSRSVGVSFTTAAVKNGTNVDAVRIDTALAPLACAHARLLIADHDRIVGLLRQVGAQQWRSAALAPHERWLQVFEPA